MLSQMPAVTSLGLVLFLSAGCATVPSGLKPVQGFQAERYIGKWYEVARLDHRFERNLTQVTAAYDLRPAGRAIWVINRGYDTRTAKWREIQGTARFVGDPTVASLRVTFFWPFSGAYNVIALDEQDYRYAMVCGANRSYLWILSREPKMDVALLADLVAKAKEWGFDVDRLIYLDPNRRP